MDRLTELAIAAKAAGMSYGQYVAYLCENDPEHAKESTRKKLRKNERMAICPICNMEFITTSSKKKYCSPYCKGKADCIKSKKYYERKG